MRALPTLAPAGLLAVVLSSPLQAVDLVHGEELHEAKCAGCHKTPHNDTFYNARKIEGRKFENKASLTTMVQACVTYFNVDWFDDDVEAVSAYLNHTYYKLK